MKLTTCINNHFYDSDKYASCPYCAKAENGTGESGDGSTPSAGVPAQTGAGTHRHTGCAKAGVRITPAGNCTGGTGFSEYSNSNRNFPFGDCVGTGRKRLPVVPEASGSAGNPAPAPATGFTANRVEEAAESAPQISSYGRHQPESTPVRSQAVNTAVHGWANQTADDEEDENCTVGYYAQVLGVEPVVGWLVCIRGAYRGESFRLKSGRNFIGRAANMDIVLGADQSVSRLRHAAVVYDPRSRRIHCSSRRCP